MGIRGDCLRHFLGLSLFLSLSAPALCDEAAPSVNSSCSDAEREQLFFAPQVSAGERPLWREPKKVSEGMICSTMGHLLSLANGTLSGTGAARSSISPECLRAVGAFWERARPDSFPPKLKSTVEFLRSEMSGFLSCLTASPVDIGGRRCFQVQADDREIRGHIRSLQEVLAESARQLRCTDSETKTELEVWARRKLDAYYASPLYRNCRAAGKTALQNLRSCEKMRDDIISVLQKKGSVNHQACLDAVREAGWAKSPDWPELASRCSAESFRSLDAKIAEARKAGLAAYMQLNATFAPCISLRDECKNLNVSSLEKNVGLCPLPKGAGQQTGGTCAFHATSAAIYMSGKGCPGSHGAGFSVGQLQEYAGLGDAWTTTQGLTGASVPKLTRELRSRGVVVTDHAQALTDITRVPIVVNALVGDVKSWTDDGFSQLLISDKAKASATPNTGLHALLVTDVISQTDASGKVTKMAVVRDANAGYFPYFIPLDQLLKASQFYASDGCSDANSCVPPALGIGH